jgi:hypothetical protein
MESKISIAQMKGGIDFVVETKSGEKITVLINTPKISQADQLVKVAFGLSSMIRFATGKDESWIDDLTEDSAFALYDKAKELADPILSPWLKRQVKGLSAMNKSLE